MTTLKASSMDENERIAHDLLYGVQLNAGEFQFVTNRIAAALAQAEIAGAQKMVAWAAKVTDTYSSGENRAYEQGRSDGMNVMLSRICNADPAQIIRGKP